MIISKRKISATPILGSFAEFVAHGVNGIVKQVYISPATSTTTYDVQLLDEDNNILFEEENVTGRLNEMVNIPVTTNMSLNVTNASVNELFTCIIASQTT